MLHWKQSKDPKKIKRYADIILKGTDLEEIEKIEVARKILESAKFHHKEPGFNIMVRDDGDEKIGVINAGIDKDYDHITIYIRNPGTDLEQMGDNWVSIYPITNKKGEVIDIRTRFHLDDNYYFDESPGCDVIVVKRDDQKPDAELKLTKNGGTHVKPR